MFQWFQDISYLVAAILFILGVKDLSAVKTARRGNFLSGVGMLLAIIVTLLDKHVINYDLIIIGVAVGTVLGAIMAFTVKMTAMPQFVAAFNGFGGLASALISASEFLRSGGQMEGFLLGTLIAGALVGAVTFTGSMVAFGKLQGFVSQQPVTYPLQKTFNLILFLASIGMGVWMFLDTGNSLAFWLLVAFSSLLGILLVLPIGGADMPVVICLLNSYSGIAASMAGFVLMNKVLIVAGALVGASGIILTEIMCRAMNRSLFNVAFGAFGKVEKAAGGKQDNEYTGVKSCTPDEVAMIMDGSQSVVVVPGYGLAVSRAQHAIKELSKALEARGVTVKYAIHPVAGRMPGHMNVLLAEADVPYDQLYEMDQINPEFEQTDLVLVVGANDVTNPAAKDQPGSPIYGMPILEVNKARSIVVIKRSLSPGFAGIKNPLYEDEKTLMLFADAKAGVDDILKALKQL